MPEVICLQEVDRYRESEVRCREWVTWGCTRSGPERLDWDGCAMFWEERFALLKERGFEFHDHIKLRDNVAQICVLERKGGCGGLGFQDRVVAGNVHVMFNPLRGHVKLGQARVLSEKMQSMSRKWGIVPVVVAGDLNSTPWSPLYRFLSSSSLDLDGLDRCCISGQEEGGESERWSKNGVSGCERLGTSSRSIRGQLISDHVALKQSGKVSRKKIPVPKEVQSWDQFQLMAATGGRHLSVAQHKLKLRSVYTEIEGKPENRAARGEPFVASFHRMFKGTVDYIWHCADLCAVRVLVTPPTSVLLRDKKNPSKRWGKRSPGFGL